MTVSGDRLLLEGMEFFGRHGDTAAERELGTHLRIDAELRLDTRTAARTDALADTVDYGACYRRIREIVEREQYRLLESLAERIATELLTERVRSIRLVVAKRPPLPGRFERFAVVIERERAEGGAGQ